MSSGDLLRHLQQQGWQDIFDGMQDFVVVLDNEFRIVAANKAMARFLERAPEDLVGRYCFEIMHDRHSPWPDCPHREMLMAGRSATEIVDDPYIGIPFLVTASPIDDDEGNLLGSIHIARDISALKETQRALERRNRELGILWRIGRTVQRSLSFQTVIAAAMEGIRTAVEPDMVMFYLKEDDDLVLRGHLPEEAAHLNERKQVGTCLCGLAAKHKTPVFSEDITLDVRCTLMECKEAGVRSFAALPVSHEEELLGVIGIASRRERDFSVQREFLETIAATVAIATRNALLFERLESHSDDLEQSVRERTRELAEKNTELERFNRLFVDREFRIKELKERVKDLEERKERRP